jgi:hypothetical protein
MKMQRKKVIISVAAAALVVGVVSPAIAENSWTSYMAGVYVGFESRVWADHDYDQVATTVKLSGCSLSGTTFKNTGITLYQDTIFPYFYTNHGLINNSCNTVSWGQGLGAGNYHFTIERINGTSASPYMLFAKTVVTGY